MTRKTAPTQPRVQKLNRRRRRYGITQDAVAARAGVHRTYVVHYFAGRRAPKHDAIGPATEALIAEAMKGRTS